MSLIFSEPYYNNHRFIITQYPQDPYHIDLIEKILKLDDRKYLSEKFQNCLMEIDKRYLLRLLEANRIGNKQEFQKILDIYEFEKELVYDKNKKNLLKFMYIDNLFNHLFYILIIIIIIIQLDN